MREKLFDSHCHLIDSRFSEDREVVIQQSYDAGVAQMLIIGTDVETSRQAIELANRYEECYAAVGISPHNSAKASKTALEQIEQLAQDPKVVAIGETGLEYHYQVAPHAVQQECLRSHLRLAHRLHLPVIFHHREADEDFKRIIEEEELPESGGVMHCFTGDENLLEWALDKGLFISYAGMMTFRNNTLLRSLLQKTHYSRLLLETDAPYLAPEPFRGNRCEPSMLIETARVAATTLRISMDDIARITRRNTQKLFGLPCPDQPVIAYPIRRSLYLNITNKCSNRCVFCLRYQDRELKGHQLHLDHEPTLQEILDALHQYPLNDYEEVVFCGYGEPTCRMEVLLEIADYLKSQDVKVRLNTNGQGNLINQSDIVPDFKNRIDQVSISLNASDPDQYQKICRSKFGINAWHAVILFIQKCKAAGIDTQVSLVELPEVDIEACEQLARDLGVPLRHRPWVPPPE